MKPVNFTPSDFGGYTFFIVTSGLIFGLNLFDAVVSFLCFLAAMTFYTRSNKREENKEILIEE